MRRRIAFATVAGLVLIATSCDRGVPMIAVTGSVTCKGSPAEGAVVFFRRREPNEEKDRPFLGVVRADGSFEMAAPAGDYDVFVEWTRRPSHGKGRTQTGRDLLAGRYADRKSPRLRASVKAESERLPAFDVSK